MRSRQREEGRRRRQKHSAAPLSGRIMLVPGTGEGVPGGNGIPEHARLLLTLPNGQPGNTALARKRRTTSHLAGPWPAGTPAGAAGGQAGRGGAGCRATARDRGPWRRGNVRVAVLRGRSRIRGWWAPRARHAGPFACDVKPAQMAQPGRFPPLSVQGRDIGEAKEVTSASNHALTSASGSPRCGLSARPASRWGS